MTLAYTSALVLLMTKDKVYQTECTKTYLEKLDLSSGLDLYNSVTDFFPDYPEVIQNRKFGVLKFIEYLLMHDSLPHQIILPAVGMDAMGLEIASLYPGTHIYEIDSEYMPEKSKLIANKSIQHIQADITQPQDCYEKLIKAGWQSELPSLIILEGISYYISPDQLKGLVNFLNPSVAICEYHTLSVAHSEQAHAISRHCFSQVLGKEGYEKLPTYSAEKLSALLDMPQLKTFDMTTLEKLRHKQNKNFKHARDGWIEVSLFGNLSTLGTLGS